MRNVFGFFALALLLPLYTEASLLPMPSLLADSKWKTADETDGFLQSPVCRAFTQASNSKEPIELSLVYPKDGKLLPMMVLKTKLTPALIDIKISGSEMEHFFLLKAGATNQDANLYWYAPQNFARMEELIRANNILNLVVDPKGTPVPVQVSLSGSSNALDATKNCLRSLVFPADFMKLLNQQKDSLIPDLGDRSPAFLFQTVQEAYNSFLAGQGIQAEIAKLRKPVQPLLDKETAALAVRKNAAAALQSATDRLYTAKTLVSTLMQKLADAKALLAALQTEKPLAEADLAKKKGIYIPLKAQMVPYEKAVADAAAAVAAIQAEITRNENLIAKNSKRIPELENESAHLQRALPGLEREASRLRGDFDDADSNYRRYDPNREKQNYLDRDASYGWARGDLDRARSNLGGAQNDERTAEWKLGDAQRALGTCKAVPNANCASQEAAVSSAEGEVNNARSRVNGYENDIRNAEQKMRDIESEAERRVRDESDRLRRIRDDAESSYSSKQREVSYAYNRIAEIRNAIPVLRDQIAKAQAALPVLNQKLTDAQAVLGQKKDAKDVFSKQIGFDLAEADFVAAQKHMNDVNGGIAAKTKEIPQITKDLAAAQKTIDPLTKTFTQAQASLAAAEAKLAPIQEQLKPFREQEAVKLAELEVESQRFKTKRAAYQDLIADLLSH